MLDMKGYQEACDRLTLDTETLEEMIEMVENQKKKILHRPTRVALLAAAMVAALGITASAAELPAEQQFFARVFVTVSTDDGVFTGLEIPTMAVEEREGHTILLLDEEEIDVTDALAEDGEYIYEGEGFEVRVNADGVAELTAKSSDGEVILSFSTAPGAQSDMVNYTVNADVGVEMEIGAEAEMGAYTVVADEKSGVFSVIDEDGKVYDYNMVDNQLIPAEAE